MKKVIRKTLVKREFCTYSTESFDDFIKPFQEAMESLPSEKRRAVVVDFGAWDNYGDTVITIDLTLEDLETDEEESQRELIELREKLQEENRERELLKRLKKKYENN